MTELMTIEEVASYLRVNERTIYKLAERRDIPARRIGRQWRFVKTSIDEWLQQDLEKTVANILIVDDDEIVCDLFEDTLQEEGHEVKTVTESSKGLELVKERDYDLVFLDLKMPGTDGAELFRQIRVVKPDLPVIIITGYPDSDLMKSALAHGPFGIMNKPFRGSDIINIVNSYLRFGKQRK